MAVEQKDRQGTGPETKEHSDLTATIRKHVMDALGKPNDLFSVQVRHLWDAHFRVNVMVGEDASCTKVAHSYFLVVDPAGSITASTPRIRKEY